MYRQYTLQNTNYKLQTANYNDITLLQKKKLTCGGTS